MLLFAPVMMLIGLFTLHVGRWSGAQLDVQHAADSAARAASMVSADRMVSEARAVALTDLLNQSSQCVSPEVSTTRLDVKGVKVIRVRVACTVNEKGVSALGASHKRVVAESFEYIDVFTYR
jgi:Flp pilus assembly protein TadG